MTTTSITALIVTEQLYSPLGSPLCKTIPVAKQGDNIGGFIDSFILDREPLNAPDGWVTGGPFDIQSDVVQWAWANNAAITDTDRQYAYQGRYPEKDPLQRTTQGARPGQAFSIQGETGADNYSIRATPGYLPSELESTLPKQLLNDDSPADLYTELSCTGTENNLGALGNIQRGAVRDFRGRTLAKTVVDDAGNNILTTNLYQMGAAYNSETSQPFMDDTELYLPNYYSMQDTSQKISTQTNVLGQNIAQVSPDAGTQLNFYDVYGRLRFSQTADQAQAGAVIYYLYDALSRMIETGFINMAWDVGTFQALTSLPDASQLAQTTTIPLRLWVYDQPTSTPGNRAIAFETMGKLIQMTSFNTMLSNTKIVVNTQSQLVATYSYDYLGRCTTYTQTLNGGTSYSSSYVYDSLSKLILLNYPQTLGSTNGFSTGYAYNIQASLSAIGSSNNSTAYASYLYNEFGQIVQENVGSNGQAVNYTYSNTLNQLVAYSDAYQLMSTNLSYTDSAGNYQDGNLQSINYRFDSNKVVVNGEPIQLIGYQYTYDTFNRLSAVEASGDTAWYMYSVKIDANNNLQSYGLGGIENTYTYIPGTNQVKSLNGGSDFTYSDSGLTLTTPSGLNFSYDLLTPLPAQITTPTDTINLIYDAKNERYQKSVGGTTITYLRGSSAWPLSELTTDSSQTTTINYIYGPNGLIVINDPSTEKNYIVLKDQLGSTRIVHEDVENVGAGSLIAYFNYLPYGELESEASQIMGSCPIPLRYLYTGQEWDRELGLYNYHARQYDPSLGRFYTPDSAHQFPSPYAYVGNNPIVSVDKTGNARRIIAYLGNVNEAEDLIIVNIFNTLTTPTGNYNITRGLFNTVEQFDTLYIVAHGSETTVGNYTPSGLVADLFGSGLPANFSGTIKLLACNSGRGERSFAQVFQDMLARRGNFVEMKAPRGYAQVRDDGIYVLKPEDYPYSQFLQRRNAANMGRINQEIEMLERRGGTDILPNSRDYSSSSLINEVRLRARKNIDSVRGVEKDEASSEGFLSLARPTQAPDNQPMDQESYWGNERFAGEEGFVGEGIL